MGLLKLTNKEDFESAIKSGVCLVDFNAVWCGPCKAQAPTIEKLADDFAGRATIAEVDVDSNQEAAVAYGVQSIPTLVVFKEGTEVQRFVGLQSESVLAGALEKVM